MVWFWFLIPRNVLLVRQVFVCKEGIPIKNRKKVNEVDFIIKSSFIKPSNYRDNYKYCQYNKCSGTHYFKVVFNY